MDRGSRPQAIDVALVPVAGWGPTLGPGHMDPRQAAASLTLLPTEGGDPDPLGHARADRLQAPDGGARPTTFVAAAAELAPDVRCVMLEPGEGSVF